MDYNYLFVPNSWISATPNVTAVLQSNVSHTNDSMVARLEEDFRQNGNEVDDPRVQIDNNHNNDSLCANCNIEIDQEHRVVQSKVWHNIGNIIILPLSGNMFDL